MGDEIDPDERMSCESHPRRTEFDCYRCGFQQADVYNRHLSRLKEIAERVVILRGQGWQRRQEMHEAISEMGVLIGIGPHPTGGRE